MSRGASGSERGFTFVEMAAAITIFSIVGIMSVNALRLTSRASSRTVFRSELDQRAHRTIERIVRELQEARLASFIPSAQEPFGADTITFVCAEVPAVERIEWGGTRRLELVPSESDPRDGLDNDHDGLVDEHELRLVRDVGTPDEYTTVLVRDVAPFLEGETADALDDNANGLVDEAGFSIAERDGTLRLRLTLMKKDPEGGTAFSTVEATVCPRN